MNFVGNGKEQIEVAIYGSRATELALENSDIDIAIKNVKVMTKEQYFDYMQKFSVSLKALPYITECKVIPTAKVPVIKLVKLIFTFSLMARLLIYR